MSFFRPRASVQVLLLAFGLASALVAVPAKAAPASPAKVAVPKLSGLKARVAQGIQVQLVASSLTASQLASLRPRFEDLKPRIRTTAD